MWSGQVKKNKQPVSDLVRRFIHFSMDFGYEAYVQALERDENDVFLLYIHRL